jgi:NAD(P)-dependent dehydrogenase (short-subunit alcohol dehydrogenase family)
MSKVILITGVSSGIGKSCAEFLSQKYDKVYGTSRREPVGTEKYKVLQMDVRDPDAVQRVIKTIVEKEGRINVLINNAGIGHGGAIENYSEEEMNMEISVNFFGKVRMIKAVLPYMRKQRNGMIINVSSIGGLMGLPFQGFYSASKFAIEGLSESLRLELKPFGIQVVQINPGDFKTGFTINRVIINAEKSANDYSEQFQSTLRKIEKDETGGNDPVLIAKKIDQIIRLKKPAFNYVVGRFDQKLSVILKRFLPSRLFFWILADYYKIK